MELTNDSNALLCPQRRCRTTNSFNMHVCMGVLTHNMCSTYVHSIGYVHSNRVLTHNMCIN